MLNLGNLYLQLNFLLGKDQYGGYVPPAGDGGFNQNLAYASIKLLDKYVQAYAATRVIENNLRPFIKTLGTPEDPYISLDSFGRFLCPADYYYWSSGYIAEQVNDCGTFTEIKNPIRHVDDAVWNYKTGSQMNYPTLEFPIMTEKSIKSGDTYLPGFIVAPVVSKISGTYIRRVPDPVFAYTVSEEDGVTIIYDAANSSCEWPESAFNDLLEQLVFAYGRNLEDGQDIQIAKNEGA